MTTALCPGSFDPPTNGHVDVLRRSLDLFDELIVGVVVNPSKEPFFSLEERQALFTGIFGEGIVEVIGFDGLLVDVAKGVGADVLVKGLREGADFEYEMAMAHMNRHLTGIETVLLPTSAEHRFISSSLVREVWRLGGDVAGLVPSVVLQALEAKR
ncbi:MAG: pantetheine-phosphate adenylyltransferase [Acidimicrobiia bacterium]|nr:pantetheine-phosphate adenylyltransferase [Acidimicrobiia bacterium]